MFLSRRTLFQGALSGFLALASRNGIASPFLKPTSPKRFIVLWMAGGPSQFETLDPKPGVSNGGPTKAIPTDVAGLQISEHLPQLANLAPDLNFLRSLTSREGEHQRATHLMHTGFSPVAAFPRPELGSVVADSHSYPSSLPSFVTLGGEQGARVGPAYLDDRCAAFEVGDANTTLQLLKQLKRRSGRFNLIDDLSQEFNARYASGIAKARSETLHRVESLLDSNLDELLKVNDQEAIYGDSSFAKDLLRARKLIESGVACVEVQLGGWDTHVNNFATVKQLCQTLDSPFAALVRDLQDRDLWEDTVVVWMGDFGRTPQINGNGGRDHFPKISNAIVAGGGFPAGQVIGNTNTSGTAIEENPVSIADFFATLLSPLGIQPDEEFTTSFGSPTEATDGGEVIAQLKI